MRDNYGRLPDAVEIDEAMALAKERMEGKVKRALKKELKRRARSIAKDNERMVSRYPWLHPSSGRH